MYQLKYNFLDFEYSEKDTKILLKIVCIFFFFLKIIVLVNKNIPNCSQKYADFLSSGGILFQRKKKNMTSYIVITRFKNAMSYKILRIQKENYFYALKIPNNVSKKCIKDNYIFNMFRTNFYHCTIIYYIYMYYVCFLIKYFVR